MKTGFPYDIKAIDAHRFSITPTEFSKKLKSVLFLCLGLSSLYSVIYCGSKNYWYEAGFSLVVSQILFLLWMWSKWGKTVFIFDSQSWTLTKQRIFKDSLLTQKNNTLAQQPLSISTRKRMGLEQFQVQLLNKNNKPIQSLGQYFTQDELAPWSNLFGKRKDTP